jgi:hypothetical protein
MSITRELLDTPSPATRAESAALLVEVVNVALYGGEDPWNSDFLGKDTGIELPAIDKGHIADAISKSGGSNVQCKYDPESRDSLLYGSGDKVKIASLAIGEKTYDIYAATTEFHSPDDDQDVLSNMFDLLENNEGAEEIEEARSLDFEALADDVIIEVYEDLPQHSLFMRNIGKLGIQFAELVDDNSTPGRIAESEGMLAQAASADEALDMELNMAATTIDSQTARALIATLREDYEPVARW